MSCAKTAEPIEMQFRMWTQVGSDKHILDAGAYWRNLGITNEPSVCGGYAAFLSNYFENLLSLGHIAILRTCGLLHVTDGIAWSVGLYACLSVCHDREPCNKSSAVAEMGVGLATIDMGRKLYGRRQGRRQSLRA